MLSALAMSEIRRASLISTRGDSIGCQVVEDIAGETTRTAISPTRLGATRGKATTELGLSSTEDSTGGDAKTTVHRAQGAKPGHFNWSSDVANIKIWTSYERTMENNGKYAKSKGKKRGF